MEEVFGKCAEKLDFGWNVLDHTRTRHNDQFRSVPLQVTDQKRAGVFDYNVRGMQDFYPWFVSEKNSAKHTDVIGTMVDFFPFFQILIQEKKQYPFIRCDINIFLTLMKVCATRF